MPPGSEHLHAVQPPSHQRYVNYVTEFMEEQGLWSLVAPPDSDLDEHLMWPDVGHGDLRQIEDLGAPEAAHCDGLHPGSPTIHNGTCRFNDLPNGRFNELLHRCTEWDRDVECGHSADRGHQVSMGLFGDDRHDLGTDAAALMALVDDQESAGLCHRSQDRLLVERYETT